MSIIILRFVAEDSRILMLGTAWKRRCLGLSLAVISYHGKSEKPPWFLSPFRVLEDCEQCSREAVPVGEVTEGEDAQWAVPGAFLPRPAPQVNSGLNPEAPRESLLLCKVLEIRKTPRWRRGKWRISSLHRVSVSLKEPSSCSVLNKPLKPCDQL